MGVMKHPAMIKKNVLPYFSNRRDPVAVFSGHTNSTFYVKSCVSSDNQFLISGSSSNSLFVWDIKQPLLPPVKLDGHSGQYLCVW